MLNKVSSVVGINKCDKASRKIRKEGPIQSICLNTESTNTEVQTKVHQQRSQRPQERSDHNVKTYDELDRDIENGLESDAQLDN